ncbi:MAG: glycosyltransferase family 4 protein [Sedimentisphaerales bacterium]|nr:glycosyltransferase family 4 protein [Sedimentisphaerales bacterium]
MRILWLVNDPLPDLAAILGITATTGGGWLTALSQGLSSEESIELGIASRVPYGKPLDISLKGIRYFTVPAPRKGFGLLYPTNDMLFRYQEIVDQFSPDVIHVHGTEWYGGLVTVGNRMGYPTIVSLQGLIDHHRRHFLGQLGFFDILRSRTLKEWLMFGGLWRQRWQWSRRAIVEREIIRGHQIFDGRTLWDRAQLRRLNPDALYFQCQRVVRQEFFKREWFLSTVNRHTIFTSSASYPLKGFHVLVRAVAILRREFPDVRVRVPLASFKVPTDKNDLFAQMRGDGYSNYLAGLIDKLDVGNHIVPLGQLSGEEMANEMEHAHVFALSSFVENSPNAMAEALTVGVPSVVSLAGGIPSLIDDGRDALGFPPGDEAVLAEQIRHIFHDDSLAIQLSRAGRETARLRHSPEAIVQRMVEIYRAVAHKGLLVEKV